MNVPPLNTESLATAVEQLTDGAAALVQNALIGRRRSVFLSVPVANFNKVLFAVKDGFAGAPCCPPSETFLAAPWCHSTFGASWTSMWLAVVPGSV